METSEQPALVPLAEARHRLAEAARPLPPVELSPAESSGLVLAAEARATLNLPHEDVSAMDGYAAQRDDLANGRPLPVAFEAAAGTPERELGPGVAARIFTGAPVPRGADTVVPQEQAERLADGSVRLEALAAGSHIRRKGEVCARGDRLAAVSTQVSPWLIALLAGAGADMVQVHPLPRFAVVLTGSELVDSGSEPASGQIRDSNGPMLDALITGAGFVAPSIRRAPDDPHELKRALVDAFGGAEIVLTSGGVSVGDYDYVPRVVRELDGEILFHRVAVKPGKPVLAARVGRKWILGLPGNPLSVLSGWRMFALPLASVLMGREGAFDERPRRGVLGEPAINKAGRELLMPCVRHWDGDRTVISPLPWKGSHDLYIGAQAHVFARIEPGRELPAGGEVAYYELDRLHVETFRAPHRGDEGSDELAAML